MFYEPRVAPGSVYGIQLAILRRSGACLYFPAPLCAGGGAFFVEGKLVSWDRGAVPERLFRACRPEIIKMLNRGK